MAATNAARAWADPSAPADQPKQRSWAQNVYDRLDDEPESPNPPMPGARVRHDPAASTQRLYAVSGGRSERTTYRPAAPAIPPMAEPERQYAPAPRAASLSQATATARMALYGLGAAAVAVLLYLVVSTLITWTQIKIDDMTYGTPRTTHLDAVVGNGDSAAQPTHFIAINLNRQVSVIELPAGDISKAIAITGPYLFGDGEDLTPVKLRVADLNGDGKPDLIVDVKNEELVYINDKNTFRPITADEKARIEKAAAAPAAPAGK